MRGAEFLQKLMENFSKVVEFWKIGVGLVEA